MPGVPREPAEAGGKRLRVGALVALAVALAAAVMAITSSHERSLAGLSTEQRTALLSHTVDELREFCGAGRPDSLREHCRELAAFAARFEECQGECEALVRPLLTPNPTR